MKSRLAHVYASAALTLCVLVSPVSWAGSGLLVQCPETHTRNRILTNLRESNCDAPAQPQTMPIQPIKRSPSHQAPALSEEADPQPTREPAPVAPSRAAPMAVDFERIERVSYDLSPRQRARLAVLEEELAHQQSRLRAMQAVRGVAGADDFGFGLCRKSAALNNAMFPLQPLQEEILRTEENMAAIQREMMLIR
jgi:hypothetical protein